MRIVNIYEQDDIEEEYQDFENYADDTIDKAETVVSDIQDYDIYADDSVGNYEDNDYFIREKARETSKKLGEIIKKLEDLKSELDKRIESAKCDRWN